MVSGGWTLPFDRWGAQGDVAKKFTGGWDLYPIFSTQAGSPIDMKVYSSVNSLSHPGPSGYGDQNADGRAFSQRATSNKTPTRCKPSLMAWENTITGNFAYNPANFGLDSCIASNSYSTCPLGFYGTYRRNSFIGPGSTNLDMALGKKFPVGERLTAEFRAKAFNLFQSRGIRESPGSWDPQDHFRVVQERSRQRCRRESCS